MTYIQRKYPNETVAEFTTRAEAQEMLKEYQQCFPYATYYLSSRPCKNWK